MPSRSFSFITFAGVLILAIACSGDNPAGPDVSSQLNSSGAPLSSAIKSDIAAAAGNAIALDLETLIANEAAAVGSFAVFAPVASPAFDGGTSSSTPPSNPPAEQPNCSAGNQPGVFLCAKEPGPGDHLKCTYSDEKKLFICVKQEEPSSPPSGEPKPPASNPPSGEPKPPASNPPSGDPQPPTPAPQNSESCAFNAAALIYSCVKPGEGKSVVKSYQFLDASGNPMEKFVKGATES